MTRLLLAALALALTVPQSVRPQERVRARELGIDVGVFEPGPLNAITDVSGVLVGHATVREGERVRTGVTAIRPHPGNAYRSRVPAAIHVGNGYGKLLGVTQVRELGELETPILLTCTLCVWRAADALVAWALEQDGMGEVESLNAVVGETNDGTLNDIRARPISGRHVREALESAGSGPVPEGAVGAGTGTRAFGWKGGIGTSSRVLPRGLGGYTVGVLVQSNFGGILSIDGAPVGRELGRYSFRAELEHGERDGPGDDDGQGSIMMVVATDAPLSDRNLQRLAARSIMGIARTGSFAGNGSGDYVIAFSTAESVRRDPSSERHALTELANPGMSALFAAVVEATEEAVYNSLFMARTTTGMGATVEALPIGSTTEILRRYGVIRQ